VSDEFAQFKCLTQGNNGELTYHRDLVPPASYDVKCRCHSRDRIPRARASRKCARASRDRRSRFST
jgi:hypothetical protein